MAVTNLYRWGAYAEYVVVDATVLSRLPDELSFEQAAALPCAGLTAWQTVHRKLKLQQPGQTRSSTTARVTCLPRPCA